MRRISAKTVLALALAVVLTLALCAPAFAARTVLSPQSLTVNGKSVDCQKYNIDDRNYFKLRDLAELLDGTTSQFDVDYDLESNTVVITTGAPYTHRDGTELKTGEDKSETAKASPQSVKIDGELCQDLTAYNIDNNNYFQLRELGKVLGFYVHYDEATNTAVVDSADEDEDFTTGDASLDDPRNQDGMGATEVLVVSFGTSFNDSRRLTIGAIEAAMEKAFPGYDVRRGFTADIVINHIYKRDDVKIDNVKQALDRAVDNGVSYLLVQPTHLMNGYEYTDLQEELKAYEGKFKTIVLGDPILTSDEDYDVVIQAITEATAAEAKEPGTAICFMGHGTEAKSNHVYADMQAKLLEKGYKNYYIGTVEAEPSLQDVVDAVKAAGYTKVYLEPLMIVAGDHANNDMADPEDEESWVSLFRAAGIEATPILRGLGSMEPIQQLLIAHAKAAIEGAQTVDLPKRDIADASDMTTVKEVEEEGMTPITADKLKEGTYTVKVKSSSSMFKIVDAQLTVKDGAMTAVLTMSGKSYTWMFMDATDKIAAAADSDFIPYETDGDGAFTFTVPVKALDEGIPCAAYSKNKDKWYARTLLFRADSLPEGALIG